SVDPEPEGVKEQDYAQVVGSAPVFDTKTGVVSKPLRSSRWIDALGWFAGMGAATYAFGVDVPSLLATAAVLPFLTRALYATQLWGHEVLGHAVPEGLRTKQWSKALSFKNLVGNFSLSQWGQLLNPWIIPDAGNPYVLPVAEVDTRVGQAGFWFTAATGLLSTVAVVLTSLHHSWLMPLIGPMGVSALAAIRASWSTDMKSGDKKDKYECGNYGIFWIGTAKEGVNPSWVQAGLDNVLRKLIVRGGQSAGQNTIIGEEFTSDGLARNFLTKVVKSKRGFGSDLVKTILQQFKKETNPKIKGVSKDTSIIFGLNGHVRYATGGPVSKKASHPFVGPQEKRIQWSLVDGKFVAEEKNVFVVVSHNGDNDAYRLHDRDLQLDEIREFFPKLVHMKKNVWIPPQEVGHGQIKPGYYDYMPLGDSPAIAPQIHFHLTQGSWRASVRFAHVMVDYKTAQRASEDGFLSVQEEDAVAAIFERVFAKKVFNEGTMSYADQLSRPNLFKDHKSFKDLWITSVEQKAPVQLATIKAFKASLVEDIEMESRLKSEAGYLLARWQHGREAREKFVDMVVEKFFTGDRMQATQEFRQRAVGSYGLVVRTSLQNDGVTIFSKAQGMTLGYNLGKNFFAFASDPLVLQGDFGDKGRLEQLFILDPRGDGEVVDVGFAHGFYMDVYSTERKKVLNLEEVLQRGYPLNERNPYYTLPLEYPDPHRIIDDDLENNTAALALRIAAWENPESADRQSAESFVSLDASRFIESYIKENSLYYPLIRPMVMRELNDLLDECVSGAGKCSSEKVQFLRFEVNKSAQESLIAGYIQSRVDQFVTKQADHKADQLLSKRAGDTELYALTKNVDAFLEGFIHEQISKAIKGLRNNFETERDHWERMKGIAKQANQTNKVDLFIAGYEKSLWLGENLKEMYNLFFPKMKVAVTSSNKNLKDPFQFGIHRRALALIISLSGGTFPSLALASLLKKMTHGNAFVMTSRMDSMINMAIGQRLNPDEPFTKRVFLTGDYYPAEAAPTSDIMLYAEQILLMIYSVKRLKEIFPHQNPWGLSADEADIKKLEAMIHGMVMDSRRITGFDEQHKATKDSVNATLVSHGKYLAGHLQETPHVNFLFRVFVLGVFICGAPIHHILGLLGIDPGAALNSWQGLAAASADALLACSMPFLLTTVLYRSWTHRPRWARLGAPTMAIGDSPAVHQITEAYVSKLGANAPGSMGMDVHGGNPQDHFGARFAHRIVRGIQIILGLPTDPAGRNAVVVTAKQAKGIRNGLLGNLFSGGAEVTTIGRGDFTNIDATDQHINIGGEAVGPNDSELVKKFNTISFDPLGRLLAYKVMFNAMYKKASTITIIPKFTVNLGLFKITVEPKAYTIWNRAWTYPSISVHTTRSPIGINEEAAAKVDTMSTEVLEHKKEAVLVSDKAALAQADIKTKGGVDMDSRLMSLDVKGEDHVAMSSDERVRGWVSMSGLVPTVGTVVPVTSVMLQAMLGPEYIQ
ncbi:MAG: hypothetical protein HQL15_09560, partial [Candidatus Omnitrophica bacterium]|nr:hypothetical protein [Candidatus Omnitrophota bacterium]